MIMHYFNRSIILCYPGGIDFIAIFDLQLTFHPNKSSNVVHVQILTDTFVEETESFIVSLYSDTPRVKFTNQSACIIIIDDDGESLEYYNYGVHLKLFLSLKLFFQAR